jgi:hypothetical protein
LSRDDGSGAQLPDQYWTWVNGSQMDRFGDVQFSIGYPAYNSSKCAGIYHEKGIISTDCSTSRPYTVRDTLGYSPLCSIPCK